MSITASQTWLTRRKQSGWRFAGAVLCATAAAAGIAASSFPESRAPIRATYRASLAGRINMFVDQRIEAWLEAYRDLHAHPELSLGEVESARKMAERLRTAGYTVTTGVGGHGVVGVLSNGKGPTVLIRGDMDALPIVEETGLPYASRVKARNADGIEVGVMHACGHDVHQTCLFATAETLAETRDAWSGTLVIVAQPAEEIGRGAKMMIDDGLFDRFPRPDFCLALHVSANYPAGTTAYTSGWALANVDSVDIIIHGRGGHGSRPHEAVDPIVTAAQMILAFQTLVSRRIEPTEPAVVTVGSIHAGTKHNIIPDETRMQLTVRSYTDATRATLLDGIRQIAVETARAMNCPRDPEVVVHDEEFTPAMYNDPALSEAAAAVLREVLGADNVIEIRGQMGGEDFGRFARHLNVPGFMFWLGAVEARRYAASKEPDGPPLPAIHSSRFAPDPKPTIQTGVRCMTSLALSLLDEKQQR